MHSRRQLLVLGAAALAAPLAAFGQAKPRRIGVLSARSRSTPSNPEPYFGAFVQGMRELGYVEGKNLAIEWRYADGKHERLPALAAELVKLKPEVIVTHATPAVHALKRATNTIPIVMTSTGDPVGSGLAASLARPGGNITGLTLITIDLTPKQVELLQAMVPALSRIAVFMNPGTSSHPGVLRSAQAAAQSRGILVVPVHAANPEEIERGFEKLKQDGVNAALFATDSLWALQRRQIAELAVRHRVATMQMDREFVEAGSLMSYSTNVADSYRRAATYVDRILKGAKPGDLPIEQPTKIYLVINRKTAKAIGLEIPRELLARADEVIE
jgi:putative ABC transport system substrate-binding protein